MDIEFPQKFPFILDRNLAKDNCTRNRVWASCDIVVIGFYLIVLSVCMITDMTSMHGKKCFK